MNSGELNLKIVREVEGRITVEGLKSSATKLIPKNCVLIGLAGQGRTRGTAAVNLIELCTNQSIAAILPNESFDSLYLYYNIESRYEELRELSAGGGGRGGLNLSLIKKLEIPFPEKWEQKAIAEALSDIDELIQILEKLSFKKMNMFKGVISNTFGDRAKNFPKVKLGNISTMKSGGTPLSSVKHYYGQGYKWVSISDISKAGKYLKSTDREITQAGLNNSSAYIYARETLLFAMYASIGKCSIALEAVTSSQAILGIKCSEGLNLEYLYYYMSFIQADLINQGQQGTQSNLNAGTVKSLLIPLPSPKEQQKIVDQLSSLDDEIMARRDLIVKYKWIKEGMMHDLLTGKVRLV
jgi:type I restriction enzyme S subunit